MDYVVVFLLGMLASASMIRWLIQQGIKRLTDGLDLETAKEKPTDNMLLKVEQEQNIYFLYNATDDSFVCQGTNVMELRKYFQQRFPGRRAEITGDKELLEKLHKEIEAFNEDSSSVGRTS